MEPDDHALFRSMARMRVFEEVTAALWQEGAISGELHLGIGEEGIVAGILAHLDDRDSLALDHRPTPALVGLGVDPEAIVLELLGSEEGLCRGRGGRMHLFAPDHLAASSGIVGAAAPAATGFAMAARRLRPGGVAVAFFGEGAMNQGMVLESINLASVWRLPVLFVCKDNGWAITTRSSRVTAGSLAGRAGGLGVHVDTLDGGDVKSVWRVAGSAVQRARKGRGPTFLHAKCVRPEGHLLGDPLKRMTSDPLGQTRELSGPLAKAVAARRGGRVGARIAGLGGIGRTVARHTWDQYLQRRDPLLRLRGRLEVETADEIEARARDEMNEAVAKAVSRLDEDREVSRDG